MTEMNKMRGSSFYNEYRPLRFEDVLGQQSVEVLRKQSKLQAFAHSYILHGQSGTGKTSTARIMAMSMTCQNMDGTGEPCGKCFSCQGITKGNSLAVIEIDGARYTKVEDARDLVQKAYLAPWGSNKKIYIIDESHRLSQQSWDTLLKLIEEPPSHLVLIFTTTNIQAIPITVQSRCQLYPFYPLKAESIKQKFDLILRDWGIELSTSAFNNAELQMIRDNLSVAMEQGNMRGAENTLEQIMVMRM